MTRQAHPDDVAEIEALRQQIVVLTIERDAAWEQSHQAQSSASTARYSELRATSRLEQAYATISKLELEIAGLKGQPTDPKELIIG